MLSASNRPGLVAETESCVLHGTNRGLSTFTVYARSAGSQPDINAIDARWLLSLRSLESRIFLSHLGMESRVFPVITKT